MPMQSHAPSKGHKECLPADGCAQLLRLKVSSGCAKNHRSISQKGKKKKVNPIYECSTNNFLSTFFFFLQKLWNRCIFSFLPSRGSFSIDKASSDNCRLLWNTFVEFIDLAPLFPKRWEHVLFYSQGLHKHMLEEAILISWKECVFQNSLCYKILVQNYLSPKPNLFPWEESCMIKNTVQIAICIPPGVKSLPYAISLCWWSQWFSGK